ncbi:MAG: endonuclease III [Clostridia bacterium]|nr:endonuclease III [Clostridia bacterium]
MAKDIESVIDYFTELFPNAKCELNYETPYQLLVAVILSAQCTDKRVNQVTSNLFKLAPTPQKMIELGVEKLKEIIKSCGFFNQKAKSIIETTNEIIIHHSGNVPNNMNELTKLKGVGRKTANVVLGEYYKVPSIAVDTHVLRISKRLKLTTKNATPEKCEKDLLKIVEKDKQVQFHHQAIWFGRYHCKAINPNCKNCKLQNRCTHYKEKSKKKIKE